MSANHDPLKSVLTEEEFDFVTYYLAEHGVYVATASLYECYNTMCTIITRLATELAETRNAVEVYSKTANNLGRQLEKAKKESQVLWKGVRDLSIVDSKLTPKNVPEYVPSIDVAEFIFETCKILFAKLPVTMDGVRFIPTDNYEAWCLWRYGEKSSSPLAVGKCYLREPIDHDNISSDMNWRVEDTNVPYVCFIGPYSTEKAAEAALKMKDG